MIAELLATPVDPKRERNTTIDSVTLKGASAEVTQHYEASWVNIDARGSPHHIHLIAHSHDRWKRHERFWLLEATATDAMRVEVDGRIVVDRPQAPEPMT